jgi:hypothetical protein
MISIAGMSVFCNAAFADDDVPFIKTVPLSDVHIMPDTGNSVVRAFILTRSKKDGCLVTPNESNNAVAGLTVFCGVRQPSIYGGLPGIMITAFFPGPVSSPLILSVNLHQDGAKMYGAPVACSSAEGC